MMTGIFMRVIEHMWVIRNWETCEDTNPYPRGWWRPGISPWLN